jgi:hypothetical protein
MISKWDHRVLAHKQKDGEVYYQIHEVYYDKEENATAYTTNPVSIIGDSITGIQRVLDNLKDSLNKPVLWGGEDFPKECE